MNVQAAQDLVLVLAHVNKLGVTQRMVDVLPMFACRYLTEDPTIALAFECARREMMEGRAGAAIKMLENALTLVRVSPQPLRVLQGGGRPRRTRRRPPKPVKLVLVHGGHNA